MSDEDTRTPQQNIVSGTQNNASRDQYNAARDQFIINSPFVQAPVEIAPPSPSNSSAAHAIQSADTPSRNVSDNL